MAWDRDAPQGHESRKIKYLLPRYTRGRVLEIGPGTEKAFPHFIGYDSGHHFGKGAADIVGDAAVLSLFADESFDAVFSSHVLEHMEDMKATLAEWGRVIKPGGFLCLYVPSANLYPKCGEPGANPDHKHDIYPGDITALLERLPYFWTRVESEERGEGIEYSIFEVYRKDEPRLATPVQYPSPMLDTRRKTACVVRYGGFGDMLQAASILPRLKEQGYHVTVMTTPKGRDVIRHDPHVDDWYIQDPDQVPNEELAAFWHVQSQRFDLFVNLSESIEGTLLGIPGRANHGWPQALRHRMLNKNYFDFTAELAGVDFKPCKLFYPTEEEALLADNLSGPGFTVLWSLAGSSIHKFTPHQDAVIARMLLEIPEARIHLVGDEACKLLEMGWENEPRITCLSGELSIRDTLTLAQRVDLVIGPETGVLNSVAHEPNAKVLLLSHSSKKNLSQHWYNTHSLTPVDCPCHPCHRLHYSSQFCDVDPATGTALCMRNITPDMIWDGVWKSYQAWRKKK